MTNYFNSIGSKPTIQSDNKFTKDDYDKELLFNYAKATQLTKTDLKKIDDMYKQWYIRLFSGFNIVVQGQQSLLKLLETFKERFLDPEKVLTVRLHGMTPITTDEFVTGVFGPNGNVKSFIAKTVASKRHYLFMMHSFELIYKDCRDICSLIFQICRECSEYCHILLSSDHVNAGKILSKLKIPLQLVFFFTNYGESFIIERTYAELSLGPGQAGAADLITEVSSLEDVYQAMQRNCQKIMLYILTQRGKQDVESIEFNDLFEYCQANFILRRADMLKDHLGELQDHMIVKQSGNKIQCLTSIEACQRFLMSKNSEQL